jgi:hypothetical protein
LNHDPDFGSARPPHHPLHRPGCSCEHHPRLHGGNLHQETSSLEIRCSHGHDTRTSYLCMADSSVSDSGNRTSGRPPSAQENGSRRDRRNIGEFGDFLHTRLLDMVVACRQGSTTNLPRCTVQMGLLCGSQSKLWIGQDNSN